MKKQILIIFTGALEIGGIERSLIGLLETIDYNQYDVDLFLYGHHGALYDYIHPRVKILPEVRELAYLRESFVTKLKHGCFYSAGMRLRDEIMLKFKVTSNDHTWNMIMRKFAPQIDKEYDLALSFFVPFAFLKEKVTAKKKIGWVHTDYSTEVYPHEVLLDEFSGLDYIAAVSESCAEAFKKIVPELSEKVVVIENILSARFIQEQAKAFSVEKEMPSEDNIVNLLSIGRFCTAKNFDNIPFICKCIMEMGCSVRWYIIGFGPDEELIKNRIKEAGMEDHVILLGKKDNPYPYILNCDIYVQPSRYEGKCVAVREAQILHKPVAITNYTTANGQLINGVDGVIVPKDNEGCAKGIVELIKDTNKMCQIAKNTWENDYTNVTELVKLYDLI